MPRTQLSKPPTRTSYSITKKHLRAQRIQDVRVLENRNCGPKAARIALADRISGCSRKEPCCSAACSVCAVRHQQEAIQSLETLWPEGTDLVLVTAISESLARPLEDLRTLKLASIKRHFRRKLEKAGCGDVPVWGYIDVSWNEHADGEYLSHWLPHLHFVTAAENAERLRLGLKKVLKKTPSTKRPYRIDPIREWDRANILRQ